MERRTYLKAESETQPLPSSKDSGPLRAPLGEPGPVKGRAPSFQNAHQEPEKTPKAKNRDWALMFKVEEVRTINDNAGDLFAFRSRLHHFALGALVVFVGVTMSLNVSGILSQAALHIDDNLLLTAMELNPEALAYALNAIDVGE
ncbi:MAG: hypothetical protein K9G62_00555 [Alphaproteobacteria bacterium]|nr:hypothetical protein [Alphaproteobacteria bacterium]